MLWSTLSGCAHCKIAPMSQLGLQFKAQGRWFTAVDSDWTKDGYRIYDILDETGEYIDILLVHPLDSIVSTVDEWAKNYNGSSGPSLWLEWLSPLSHSVKPTSQKRTIP